MGELSSRSRALLPAIAALGGMLVPALVYAWCNRAQPRAARRLADSDRHRHRVRTGRAGTAGIAGAPPALRIFLLALAVIDDLGAIVLIAVLFTQQLSWLAIAARGVCLVAAAGASTAPASRGWRRTCIVGFLLWLSVLKSGVHATLAGVALGLAIPIAARWQRAVLQRSSNMRCIPG